MGPCDSKQLHKKENQQDIIDNYSNKPLVPNKPFNNKLALNKSEAQNFIASIQSSKQEEKIILQEKLFRIQGKQVHTLLHRSIGALTWLSKNKHQAVGSGVLISKNMVLTAAHNVYSRPENWQSSNFKFYLGADGIAKDYYEVEDVRYSEKIKSYDSDSKKLDFALLKLKKKVQYNQFLRISLPCKQCLTDKNCDKYLQIFGFPGSFQQNFLPLDKFGKQLKLSQYGLARDGRIVVMDPSTGKIGYGISTLPGQSGCPVCIDQTIIAIHVGGGKANEDFNVGRLIDIPLFCALEKWCKQLKGDPFQLDSKNSCPHIEATLKEYLREKEEQRKRSILNLEGKGLKEINLSGEKHLTEINLNYNQLSAIDICTNINLTKLRLGSNQLSAIDVSKNMNLTQLDLRSNQLTAIDVSNNISLAQLWLSFNKLSSIDLSNNINLTQLDFWNNQLSAINISNSINLIDLDLSQNQLSAIDVSNNINLAHLDLRQNQLSAINVCNNINLIHLDLRWNQLTAIDVSKNINLTQLWLYSNKLSVINISINTNLAQLCLQDNQLFDIDVSNSINLTKLWLYSNKFSAININNNINLIELWLYSNQLSAIDVSKNVNLTKLGLSYNKISAIDIGNNINLTYLDLSSNELSAIKLKNNINLTQISLRSNQLSQIDIINNINLTYLDLSYNQLSVIDARNSTKLNQLYLSQNQLFAIDVSNCAKLTSLSLQDNSLKSVLLSIPSLLQRTNFSNQRSEVCEVRLLYNERDSQECNQQAKQWTVKYHQGGKKNDHGCIYAFVCYKRK